MPTSSLETRPRNSRGSVRMIGTCQSLNEHILATIRNSDNRASLLPHTSSITFLCINLGQIHRATRNLKYDPITKYLQRGITTRTLWLGPPGTHLNPRQSRHHPCLALTSDDASKRESQRPASIIEQRQQFQNQDYVLNHNFTLWHIDSWKV